MVKLLNRFSVALSIFLLLPIDQVTAEDNLDDAIESTRELLPLTWEELTALDVSSLARQEQSVKNSPAAAFVITSEDIRRAGVNSLPEVLRMVPGMNVARINAWNWAISARGFNDLYANKLQVMIDGRTIYDPLVSGVYWGQQNQTLQDIERIEVLRGPSGSLWGANAVNGVINIVTRSASDTQGGLLYGGGGTEEHGYGGLRYGGKISESTYLRGTINTVNRDASIDLNGIEDTHDYGNTQNANVRLDSQLGEHDQLMVEANFTRFRQHGYLIGVATPNPPAWRQDDFGRDGYIGSLQGTWEHQSESGHHSNLTMSFTQNNWDLTTNAMSRSHYVLDFQHSLPVLGDHHLMWGLKYQMIHDDFNNTLTLGFEPNKFTQNNFGIFLQDQYDFTENLKLIVGNRVEYFTYTGWETEPNMRLLWMPNKEHSVWAAVSRAVVLPNRAQHSIRILTQISEPKVFVEATANSQMRTENLLAFELGWRWQIANNFDIDTALFYNIYDRMQGTQFTGSVTDSHYPVPGALEATVCNCRHVESYGLELATNYRINHDWRLQMSYSFNQFDVRYDESQSWFRDPLAEPHFNPNNTLSLRSLINVTNEIEFDAWARYVDRLYIDQRSIPDYFTLDLRLGWHPHKDLEFSISGQNLLDSQHPEFSDILYITTPSQIQRAFLAQVSWYF